MKKHGTAAALGAGALVVREDHHDIIEAVDPAHRLMARGIRQAHRPVVVAIAHLIAPAIGICRNAGRKPRSRRQGSVAPIHNSQKPPAAHGCGAIAFFFQMGAAGSADNAGKPHGPHAHHAFRGFHADRANVNICDDFPHGDLSCGRCYQQAKVTVTAIRGVASPPCSKAFGK